MTEVDIANLALAHLGAEPIRSLTDPTYYAKLLAAYLPMARDQVLRAHEWRCAMKRSRLVDISWKASASVALADIIMVGGNYYECTQAGTTGETLPESWPATGNIADGGVIWTYTTSNRSPYAYQYALPADCLRMIELTGSASPWIVEGTTLYTDAPPSSEGNPIVRYTRTMPSPADWDANLCGLVALKLAINLAPAISKSTQTMMVLASLYQQAFRLAKIASAGSGASPEAEPAKWTDV